MDTYQQILATYWGFTKFRASQEEIIESVCSGKDTLGLLATGGGKSIIFQVAGMAKPGICLVITPLIALMKDQVDKLKSIGIKAASIHSGMSKGEIDITINNCLYGDYKFLYISPERIDSELFWLRVGKMNVNLITVDEAHCISQWGYDFRPSYLKIARLRELFPRVPILALTASATPKVIDDIQEKLLFKTQHVIRKTFERKNLIYVVRKAEDKQKQLLDILKKIGGSGIIYTRNRKTTKELTLLINKNRFSADYYHAGLSTEIRNDKQENWMSGNIKIMIATNAFGMGIDKADVRFVIHYNLPDSIEAYFQESGRAGRDEKTSYAILLINAADLSKAKRRVNDNFPEIQTIKKVYQAIGNYFQIAYGSGKGAVFDFNLVDFISTYKFNLSVAYNSFKFLEKEGYIELTDELDNPSRIIFLVTREDLYKFQVANAALDGFIKLILRSYTGLFNEYVNIDEQWLGKKAGLTQDVVYDYLKKLKKVGIINYVPRKKTPLLAFTEERIDDKNLRISKENYSERKNRYIEKLDAVLDYVNSQAKCRSQFLLAYFGETDTYRCGLCDICTKRNELNLSKYEFDLLLDQIKEKIGTCSLTPQELIDQIHQSPEKIVKVIQWLLDNNKITYNEEKQLTWHR